MTALLLIALSFVVSTKSFASITEEDLERSAKFCAELLGREPKTALDNELRYIAGRSMHLIETKDRDLQVLGLKTLGWFEPEPAVVRARRSSLRRRLMELMQDEDAEIRGLALVAQLRFLPESRWLGLAPTYPDVPLKPDQYQAVRDDLRRVFAKYFKLDISHVVQERTDQGTIVRGKFAVTNALDKGLFDEPFALAPKFPFSLANFELAIGGAATLREGQQIQITEASASGVHGTFTVVLDQTDLDQHDPKQNIELTFVFTSEVGAIAACIYELRTGRLLTSFFEHIFSR